MAQLTSKQYDALENAIRDGSRVSIMRRGTEYLVIPLSIGMRSGKEAITTRNPTTGDSMTVLIDELDSFAIVR